MSTPTQFTIKRSTPEQAMQNLGFVQEDTGGHCMVYRKPTSTGGYWLITTADGGAVPTHPQESILVGCYSADDEMIGCMETKFQYVLNETLKLQ